MPQIPTGSAIKLIIQLSLSDWKATRLAARGQSTTPELRRRGASQETLQLPWARKTRRSIKFCFIRARKRSASAPETCRRLDQRRFQRVVGKVIRVGHERHCSRHGFGKVSFSCPALRAPREKSLFFEKNSLLALEKFPVPLLGEFVRKPLNQLKN